MPGPAGAGAGGTHVGGAGGYPPPPGVGPGYGGLPAWLRRITCVWCGVLFWCRDEEVDLATVCPVCTWQAVLGQWARLPWTNLLMYSWW